MSDVHLYTFQKSALERVKDRNRVAFFHDMGLGKTYSGSEKLYQLGARVNLVVCQKSKINDWLKHFDEHYPDMLACDCTRWKRTDWTYLREHPEMDMFGNEPHYRYVLIINYELAWRRTELLRLHDFTLMLDESSLIQNAKAKQTKFILKLQPKNVILLSGTPCSGKYENLWTQAHLLGWDISERLFQSQYVNWTTLQIGYGYRAQFHRIVDKANPYKNVERLKQKLREHGADFLKTEECFDLPAQTFTDVKVPSSKDYAAFMAHSIVRTSDGKEFVGSTPLTKRLYARMICACSSDKLNALADLMQSTRERLVVFYSFNHELSALAQMCKEMGKPLSVVNGEGIDLEAYEKGEESVTLLQYQAGAKGLNLQKSNKVIFYSPTERCEDYMQALKRIHRIGQERPCFYYRIMCEGSVEERIYSALERGVDYTDELFKEDFGWKQ